MWGEFIMTKVSTIDEYIGNQEEKSKISYMKSG